MYATNQPQMMYVPGQAMVAQYQVADLDPNAPYTTPYTVEEEEEDDDDGTIKASRRDLNKPKTLKLWGNASTMNLNPLILTNIQSSPYFKVSLFTIKTYHEVIDEIYFRVTHIEPWEKNSRKTAGQTGMCGGVRGVGAGGIVSSAYCLLFKLFTLKLTRRQLRGLLDHRDSPYIRALGFMYIRYCLQPNDVWEWYQHYLTDEEEIDVKAGGGCVMTMGELITQWITKLEWYGTMFPRIPVPAQKKIDQHLKEWREKNMKYLEAKRETEEKEEAKKAESSNKRSASKEHDRRPTPPRRRSVSSRDRKRSNSRSSSSRYKDKQRRRSRSRSRSRSSSRHRSRATRASPSYAPYRSSPSYAPYGSSPPKSSHNNHHSSGSKDSRSKSKEKSKDKKHHSDNERHENRRHHSHRREKDEDRHQSRHHRH